MKFKYMVKFKYKNVIFLLDFIFGIFELGCFLYILRKKCVLMYFLYIGIRIRIFCIFYGL